MHPAILHLSMLLLAAGLSALGWFVAHDLAKLFQFFNFARQPEWKFFVGFCRVAGWFWAVSGVLGVVLYLALTIGDFS
jgi:hypothetical protein